eukprot:CAMPEP_0117488404 /NCGR_PEP_ID=MMETSP0784-20121206/16499_1 /TAXON_ID=39447 /ORGANISM="" /LENGTH=336 /DNA_ID=CAMNT_0005283093 /DNA_START=119 /DNA_END=1129 /DNA_ORIENTATION=+
MPFSLFSKKPSGEPTEHQALTAKAVKIAWVYAAGYFIIGVAGILAPQTLLTCMGVKISDEVGKEQLSWINGMQQLLVLHAFFLSAVHMVITGDGAVETTLKSTHHLSAVRTVLFADAVWSAIACIWIWVSIAPGLKDMGGTTATLFGLSAVIALMGVVCYSASRGEKVSAFGGLVQAQANVATLQLEVPTADPKNYVFIFWMAVCLVCAPVFMILPSLALTGFAGNLLDGPALAIGKFLAQFLGILMLGEFLAMLGLMSAGVLALQYTAARIMWVWSCSMAVFFCMSKEVYIYMGLQPAPMYVGIIGCASFSGLAYFSVTQFSKKSLTETLTGRAM